MLPRSHKVFVRLAAIAAAVLLLCVPVRAQFGMGGGDMSQFMSPVTKKAAFNDSVRRATFPTVYRPSRVSRSIDAAAKFDDLTTEQKESLASLKTAYERDAAPANDKWANEIEAAEQKGDNGGEMALSGGGRMAVRFGEEDEKSPLAVARKARRELDEKTRSRLETILSKDQKERLPKDPVEGRGAAGGQFIVDEARVR